MSWPATFWLFAGVIATTTVLWALIYRFVSGPDDEATCHRDDPNDCFLTSAEEVALIHADKPPSMLNRRMPLVSAPLDHRITVIIGKSFGFAASIPRHPHRSHRAVVLGYRHAHRLRRSVLGSRVRFCTRGKATDGHDAGS